MDSPSSSIHEDRLLQAVLHTQINVKSVNPFESESDIYQAIKIDHVKRLEHLFSLGEFDKDLRSRNAKLLRADGNSGLHTLVYLCVDHGAHRCMWFLLNWTKRPGNPYWVDQKTVFKYTKLAGLGADANVSCLVKLMEEGMADEDPHLSKVALHLMPQLRSADLIDRVHRMMITESYEVTVDPLIEQCGQRHAQPAVITTLVNFVLQRRESLNRVYHGRLGEKFGLRYSRTALSEACHSLNVDAIAILLAHGADPKVGVKGGPTTGLYNPLYRLLAQDLVLPAPEDEPSVHENCECKMTTRPEDRALYNAIFQTAFRMVAGIELLYHAFKSAGTWVESDEFVNLYHKAADIYGTTLRNYMIAKIRRHLPPSAQRQLIEIKPKPEDTGYPPQIPDVERPVPTGPQYKFLDSLNGTQLEEALLKFRLTVDPPFMTIWVALMTPENFHNMVTVVRGTVKKSRTEKTRDLLWEFLLDPKNRPPPSMWNEELGREAYDDCLEDYSDFDQDSSSQISS